MEKCLTGMQRTAQLASSLPYFLGLDGAFSERDLEAALVSHIERFLLELGHGFCFVGRQQRLPIGDKDYYVDLVAEDEADPIGLILCGSKDSAVIELLLADPDSSPDKRVKMAQYLLLDSQEVLRADLARIGAAYDKARER